MEAALKDDFNSAEAVAVLFEIAREINTNKGKDNDKANKLAALLKYLASIIGLLEADAQRLLQTAANDDDLSDADIEALIAKRNQAKADKDWGLVDQIRDELVTAKINLEDSPKELVGNEGKLRGRSRVRLKLNLVRCLYLV